MAKRQFHGLLSTADHRPVIRSATDRASVIAGALALIVGVIVALPSAAIGQETPTCNRQPATIVGTHGDDVLFGTDGDDVIVSLAGNDLIRGEAGNDVICGGRDHDEIWGGTGDDAIFGGGGPDELRGGSGYDDIYGGAGDDLLRGGVDDDSLVGGDGDDILMGGAGNDTIEGRGGSDMLYGNSGRDSLAAGLRVDEDEQVWGGWGADHIFIQPGTSVVDGGGHGDTIFWVDEARSVVVDLAAGTLMTAAGDLSVLSNIEGVMVEGPNNVVRGDDGPNRLVGCCILDGRAGNDVIAMFTDDKAGGFEVIGGPGADRLVAWGIGPGVGLVVDLENGTIAGAYTGVLSGVETVIGTQLDDTLIGDGGPNVLLGRLGDDTIIGGGGDDILRGLWGNDTVVGGPGDDKLYGGTDDDTLDGGPGSDTLDGRSGRDLCINGESVIRCEGGWFRVPDVDGALGGEGEQVMVGVTAGGPGLVAVGADHSDDSGDAAVWTSHGGIAWSRVPHDEAVFGGAGSQEMVSVTAGGPGLVAVGRQGSFPDIDAAVWTSPDGITWSRVPHDEAVFGGAGPQLMESVTAGGPGLVAVGSEESSRDDADAAVWTSPDGVTWSRVPHDEAVFGGGGWQQMASVIAGGPGLVAVGVDWSGDFDAAVWTSPDGITWSRVPHDEAVFGGAGSQLMESVTAGGLGVVAVGLAGLDGLFDAAVWTSPDGITWSRVPHNEAVLGGGVQMFDVTAGGPGLVAVGSAGFGGLPFAAVWTSPDGITWSRVPHDEAVFGGGGWQYMSGVTAGGPGLVAVGYDLSGEDGDAAVWVEAPER